MRSLGRFAVLALVAALVGCSEEEKPEPAAPVPETPAVTNAAPVEEVKAVDPDLGPVVERRIVTVTNIVTVTKTVLVTNVINVAESSRPVGEPEALSSRRTAPYFVTSDVMSDADLRRELSSCGIRVVSVTPSTRAVVEASAATIERLKAKGMYGIRPMDAVDKLGTGAEGDVVIYPLSVIDEASVTAAVKALGGDPKSDRVDGRSVIRAKLSGGNVMKLAVRGDVRRIERDCR